MSDISKKSKSKKGNAVSLSSKEVAPIPKSNKSSLIECPVCLENLPSYSFVECLCESKVCRGCCKEYILNTTTTAHCMQCKVQWSNKFISDQFTRKWLDSNADDGYRTHTKKIALEREKSKIPETLLEIPKRAARKAQLEVLDNLKSQERNLKSNLKFYNSILNEVTPEIIKIRRDINDLKQNLYYDRDLKKEVTSKERKEKEREIEKLKKVSSRLILELEDKDETKEKKRKVKEIRKELEIVQKEIREAIDALADVDHPQKTKGPSLICPCPVDGCRGAIQSDTFACVVCEQKVCKRCREPKIKTKSNKHTDDNSSVACAPVEHTGDNSPVSHASKKHACNKDALENLKLLKSDTKPCPVCAVGIFKIEGCFDPNTPILLYNGSVITASEVKVGMQLRGDDGQSRNVLDVFTGEDEMFNVEQHKLSRDFLFDYRVSSRHTLVLLLDSLPIEITVTDYINLKGETKNLLKGYASENGVITRSYPIRVKPCGRGPYVGFTLDGNHRFVAPDFTVLRNCDQMWCTQCKTAFSWSTGAIETGTIHNPHALRWQRENGTLARDLRDIPCGGLLDLYFIIQHYEIHSKYFKRVETIHRRIAEIDFRLGKCNQESYDELRMDYVTDKKTEKQWTQSIFIRERSNERKKAAADIYTTLRTISIERFRNLSETLRAHRDKIYKTVGQNNYVRRIIVHNKLSKKQKNIVKDYKINVKKEVLLFLEDMERVRVFINTAFREELALLGSTKPVQILESWHWSDDSNSVKHGVNHFVDNSTSESSSAETVSEDVVAPSVKQRYYWSDESIVSDSENSFESDVDQVQ